MQEAIKKEQVDGDLNATKYNPALGHVQGFVAYPE
jgi:hypothetical protein